MSDEDLKNIEVEKYYEEIPYNLHEQDIIDNLIDNENKPGSINMDVKIINLMKKFLKYKLKV